MQVEIWICPTEGCGNYYASSSMRGVDLTAEANKSLVGFDDRHTRSKCPDCRVRGDGEVDRVLTLVEVPMLEVTQRR
jgi:hypothetical protein